MNYRRLSELSKSLKMHQCFSTEKLGNVTFRRNDEIRRTAASLHHCMCGRLYRFWRTVTELTNRIDISHHQPVAWNERKQLCQFNRIAKVKRGRASINDSINHYRNVVATVVIC